MSLSIYNIKIKNKLLKQNCHPGYLSNPYLFVFILLLIDKIDKNYVPSLWVAMIKNHVFDKNKLIDQIDKNYVPCIVDGKSG